MLVGNNLENNQKSYSNFLSLTPICLYNSSLNFNRPNPQGLKNIDQYDKNGNGVGDECETCSNEACFTDVLTACNGLYDSIMQ